LNSNEDKSLKKFLIVWFGQLISSIGSGLTAFALGIYVFELTHSASSYSLIILFGFLPSFILRPLGGTLSDRFDRKLLMIIGDFGSAIGLILILFMMNMNVYSIWIIYLGVAFSSVFVALQNPAYKSSVTDMLSEEQFSKAGGLMQMAESSRYLISPIVAGALLSIWDIKNVLIIDILTFFVAVFTVFVIKSNYRKENKKEKIDFKSDFWEGFRYTRNNKPVFILLWMISIITFFIGFMQSLFGPMMLVFTDSQVLGRSLTIMASGMLVSSFMIGIFSKSNNQIMVVSIALVFSGLFFSMLGFSKNIIFIIITGFMFFLTLPFINTGLDVLIRKNVDNKLQGRVWSIVSVISQLGMVIAFGLSGFIADYIFNPLLMEHGILAASVGKLVGTGAGRGIAFMFVLSGLFIIAAGILFSRLKVIKSLER